MKSVFAAIGSVVPLALAVACTPTSQTGSEVAAVRSLVSFRVKVEGLKVTNANKPSQLCYAVFNAPEGFPSDTEKVVREDCLPVTSSILDFELNELPSLGKGFVVSVFQDLNMSQKLETKKFLGFDVPSEPFGFTNNPSLMSGAPTFEKCKIPGMFGAEYKITMKSM